MLVDQQQGVLAWYMRAGVLHTESRRICHCDVMFVVDQSGSVRRYEADIEQFVEGVVCELDELMMDFHYGLVVFDTSAQVVVSLQD